MNLLKTIALAASGLFTTKIEPAILGLLETIEHDLVAQLLPIVAEAASELSVAISAPGATLATDVATFIALVPATAVKVEAAGISATVHDVSTAVSAWLASGSKELSAVDAPTSAT